MARKKLAVASGRVVAEWQYGQWWPRAPAACKPHATAERCSCTAAGVRFVLGPNLVIFLDGVKTVKSIASSSNRSTIAYIDPTQINRSYETAEALFARLLVKCLEL